jgi:hypothetical protein
MKTFAFRRAGAPTDQAPTAVEVATSEQAPDTPAGPAPLAPPSGREAARREAGGVDAAPLSASAFRLLFADAAPDFAQAGVSAAFGSTAGSRRLPGPTWISVMSPWAHGRLVRRADGSFECEAHRIPGGELVCSQHGEHVQPHH